MTAWAVAALAVTAGGAFLLGRASVRRFAVEDAEHVAAIKALAYRRRNQISARGGRVVTRVVATEQMTRPYAHLDGRVGDDQLRGWHGPADDQALIGRPPLPTGPETLDVWEPAAFPQWGSVDELVVPAPLPRRRARNDDRWTWGPAGWVLGLAVLGALGVVWCAQWLAGRAHRALAAHRWCWLLAGRSQGGMCWHEPWESMRADFDPPGPRHTGGDEDWEAGDDYSGGRHAAPVDEDPLRVDTGDLSAEARLVDEHAAEQERAFNAALADLYASVTRIGAGR